MPSWSSTTKSCGSTCRIWRPVGSETALAASIARPTSSGVISRFFPATATTPRLLNPFTWGPQSARYTLSISMPAVSSASTTAFLIESTAASRFTTRPRRIPFDSATPMPTMFRLWPSPGSATIAVVFDVPTSRPTRYRSFRATPPPLPFPVVAEPALLRRAAPARRSACRRPTLTGEAPAWLPGWSPTTTRSPNLRSTYSMAGTRLRYVPREVDVRLQPLDEPLVAQPHARRVLIDDDHRVARVRDVELRDAAPESGRLRTSRRKPRRELHAPVVDPGLPARCLATGRR